MQRIKIVEIKIMTKKKTLKEALIEKGGENYYVEKERETVTNPFFMAVKRGLKECLEVTDITPLGVVYEQVLVGCEPNILNELATIIHTDKETLKFELNVPAVADDIETDGECHEYTGTQAETTEIDVPVDREKGVSPCWRRKYLEAAVWEVMQWQVREAGTAILTEQMDYMIATYILAATNATNVLTGDGDGLEFDEFAEAIGAMEALDGHPDTCLVNPADYAKLLTDEKFTNTLYAGDDATMRSGIVKTTFGVNVIRSSRMPNHMALFLEKAKAGILVIRRDVLVEPWEYPDCDRYGFTASTRYGFKALWECASYLISDT